MILGDTPYIDNAIVGQEDYKRLLYSPREQAFTIPVSIPGGMGIIPQGTVMGVITTSTTKAGMWVPKVQEDIVVGTVNPSIAKLVTDGAADTNVFIKLEDSYRFAVGDSLVASDANTDGMNAVDLGAIVSIDRTTYTHMALIVVTNNVTAAITIAQGGCVWIQTALAAPFTAATGFLLAGVNTGTGATSRGAQGVVIVRNAMFYSGALVGYDADAATDLGSATLGQYVIF